MCNELSHKYDRLYSRAEAILKRDNPCQIQHGPDGLVSCRDTRRLAANRYGPIPIAKQQALCCKGCQYLGSAGCTVKSLICKVWLCGCAWDASRTAVHQLNDIKQQAHEQGVPMGFFRTPKDVALGRQ